MIIVKVIGGLGNQLFQYALGRTIAHKNNTVLKIDITSFKTYNRKYALDNFNIIENFATEEEIRHLKYSNRLKHLAYKLTKSSKLFYKQSFINELDFAFDQNIFKSPSNVYLEGYWQSEKYFKEAGDIIRNEFTIKSKAEGINKEIAEEINSCEAVSVHVRRGDYVTNLETNKFHGLCSLEYYKEALNKITSCIENPHFFVFSDDPKWAQDNLNFDYPSRFITHNGTEKNYEDLRLMSLCKHNIIANSSFSWWGAWLNKNLDKMVVAPRKWFNNTSVDTSDLIPENWIKI